MKSALDLPNHLLNRRLISIGILMAVLVLVLLARLGVIQIFQHHRYTTLSKLNQVALIPIDPTRGLIYDRKGELLAENIPVFNLEVIPDMVKDLSSSIVRLRQIIPISDEDLKIFNKSRRSRRRFDPVPLRLQLSEAEVAKFAEVHYQFKGFRVKASMIRHYPKTNLFAHTLGYVGRINEPELAKVDSANYRASHFIGKTGIEQFYENELHGSVGHEEVEIDASGRVVRTLNRTAPIPGKNLYLTLDSHLQQVTTEAFAEIRGAAVAIDPRNGEILAMVSNPSFDPNLFVRGINQADYQALQDTITKPMFNRALRGIYPPASTVKPYLALRALDSQVISPETTIHDPGYFRLKNSSKMYRDWNLKVGGHGKINVSRAIAVSCDTFFYTLAYQIKIKEIASVLNQFGYGEKTGVDLPGEKAGLIPNPEWKRANRKTSWYVGDTINAGIGQGYLGVTPLQLANAVAIMSMSGKRNLPHLLGRGSAVSTLDPIQLQHPEIWQQVIDAMEKVINSPEGTGRRFGPLVSYTVAGKTGSAQVISTQGRKIIANEALPETSRDNSLFIAFAPVENPTIAVAVVAENNTTAPQIARKIFDAYLEPNHSAKQLNGPP